MKSLGLILLVVLIHVLLLEEVGSDEHPNKSSEERRRVSFFHYLYINRDGRLSKQEVITRLGGSTGPSERVISTLFDEDLNGDGFIYTNEF